jgi:hypothetical protein
MPYDKCSFHLSDTYSVPSVLLMTLKTICDMQFGLQSTRNISTTEFYDIIRPLKSNEKLSHFSEILGLEDQNLSVLYIALQTIISFFQTVGTFKWLVKPTASKETITENEFHEHIIETVLEIIKPLCTDLKRAKNKSKSILDQQIVRLICELCLIDSVKLTKRGENLTKKILSNLGNTSLENAQAVYEFMNDKINDLLKEKVISLTSRCKERQTNMFLALSIKAKNESEKI